MRRLRQRRAVVGLAAAAGYHHNLRTVLADGQDAFLQGDSIVRRVVTDGDTALGNGNVIIAYRRTGACQGDGCDALAADKAFSRHRVGYRIIGINSIRCRGVRNLTACICTHYIVRFQSNRTGCDRQRARGSCIDV